MSGMLKQKCALCGKDLEGKFTYLWAGQKICDQCYKAKKPGAFCFRCGREGPLYLWAGKRYCSGCYRAVSEQGLCRMCMRPLDDSTGTRWKALTGYDGKTETFALCRACAAIVEERKIRTEHGLRSSPEYKLHYNARRVPPEPCGICGRMTLTDVMKRVGLKGHERNVCPQCAGTFFDPEGTKFRHENVPVRFHGTDVIPDRKAVIARSLVETGSWHRDTVIPVRADTVTVRVMEGGEAVREYAIGPDTAQPLKGQYLHLRASIRQVADPFVANILALDGFICPKADGVPGPGTPRVRMEGYIIGSGPDSVITRLYTGSQPETKRLVLPYETTPPEVTLVGWCPECRKSFTFTARGREPMGEWVLYSEDGHDMMILTPGDKIDRLDAEFGKFFWNGKQFHSYYPFRCPHCGAPYVDQTRSDVRRATVGCLLPGHTAGIVDLRQEEEYFVTRKEHGVFAIGPEGHAVEEEG